MSAADAEGLLVFNSALSLMKIGNTSYQSMALNLSIHNHICLNGIKSYKTASGLEVDLKLGAGTENGCRP